MLLTEVTPMISTTRAIRDARYDRSEKGRARHRRYNQSEKGHVRTRHYEESAKGWVRKVRYEESVKGQLRRMWYYNQVRRLPDLLAQRERILKELEYLREEEAKILREIRTIGGEK
jgi:hypothetical protein